MSRPCRPDPDPIARPPRSVALPCAAAVLLLAACATTPPGNPVKMTEISAAPAANAPFEPVGELLFSGGRSAAYGLHRVAGPKVNVSYSSEGKWVGELDGRDVFLTPTPGKLRGPGVDLNLFWEGEQLTIRGSWFQRQVSLRISAKALQGRAGGPSYDFTRKSPAVWSGNMATGPASLEARGDAQKFPDVPMPQFVLALLAALP